MGRSDRRSRHQWEWGWSVFHLVVSTIAVAVFLALVQNGRADEPNANLPRPTLTANRAGKGSELITLDVKGNDIHRVETGTGGSADPSWSRDGRQLLFITGAQPQIYLVGAAAGKPINLTNSASPDQHPGWSPDGKNVVFTSLRDGNHEIYVMDADGKGPVNLTRNPAFDSDPSWSPDGKRILFTSNRQEGFRLYVMGTDGANVRLLVDRNLGGWVYPAWSPDAQQVIFGGAQPDGTWQIFVANADTGQGVEQLTEGAGMNGYASWSPDGRYIAYLHFDQRFDQSPEGGKLMILDLETLAHTEVAPDGLRCGASRIAWVPVDR
jgi:TolB protein